MSASIKFKNPTDRVIKLDAVGLDEVAPGAEVDIPLAIAAPKRAANGGRAKSILECIAPQLVAVDELDRKVLADVPPAPTPVSKVVTVSPRMQPVEAPGVKALREKREALAQTKATPEATK